MRVAIGLVVCSSALGAQSSATAILDRVTMNPQRPIDFHAIVLPTTVFVGQQVTYQVAVMLSPDARTRLRRNPEFLPPELRGLLAYELGTPTRVPARNYSGSVFEAHVFQRALFPVASGTHVVPAPQLTYGLPQSSSYFSREERFVVRAESASFIVKALPTDDRPDDFNGAVGVFKSSVRIDTTSVRVGDPIVLTLRVQGTGNVKLLPRPNIELEWASLVAGTERIFVDSSGSLVRGAKEFDWILTPARDGRVGIPSLRYAYFDPYVARYAVAESAPMELSIRTGALAVSNDGESATLLPLRARTGTSRTVVTWSGRGRPPTTWLWWLVLSMVVPLPALWWSRAAKRAPRRRRVARDSGAVGAPTSDSAHGERGAARTTRRTLLAALSSRFAQNPQALVSRRHVARVLRRAGVTRETTRDMLTLLERLDELGFASDDVDRREVSASGANAEAVVAARAKDLLRRVETEALPSGRQIPVSTTVALHVLFGLVWVCAVRTPLHSQVSVPYADAPTRVSAGDPMVAYATAYATAHDAYARRAFVEAAQRFRALAAQHPRNPDLLTDWGTAAWAAGDTVNAVIAWQRAARLEPLAVDIQEHMSMLPSGSRGGIADVPMFPVAWLVRAALILWLAGWGVLSVRAWRRRHPAALAASPASRWVRDTARLALVLAALSAGAAWWGMRALDASALAVVTRPETLRIAPGTDADAMGGVTTGDVVRVGESRDAWQRIVHADGRKGWLPAARLEALQVPMAGPLSDSLPERLPRDLPAR